MVLQEDMKEAIRWKLVSVLPNDKTEEEMAEQVPQEDCNIWNWEWNPRCVCTECYLG